MKLFKSWDNEAASFVFFLGKEARDHARRMRKFYTEYQHKGNVESLGKYTVQCGSAMQTLSLYDIAKLHFKLDTFNRKHIKTQHTTNN